MPNMLALNAKTGTIDSYSFWKVINELRLEGGENTVRHDDFVSRIKSECPDISLRNFRSERGKSILGCQLDRDQMLLVGMRESAVVRRKVLDWIKKAEAYISDRLEARLMAPEMTAAIQHLKESEGKTAKPYHYSNEFDMINRIVMGIPASKIRTELCIDRAEPIRDHLYPEAVEAIRVLQQYNTAFLEAGISYEERKRHLELIYKNRFSQKLHDAVLRECA